MPMLSPIYVLTVTFSYQYSEARVITEVYSTLEAANRAAHAHHKDSLDCNCYEIKYGRGPDLHMPHEVDCGVPYYAHMFKRAGKDQIQIRVAPAEILGPDPGSMSSRERYGMWQEYVPRWDESEGEDEKHYSGGDEASCDGASEDEVRREKMVEPKYLMRKALQDWRDESGIKIHFGSGDENGEDSQSELMEMRTEKVMEKRYTMRKVRQDNVRVEDEQNTEAGQAVTKMEARGEKVLREKDQSREVSAGFRTFRDGDDDSYRDSDEANTSDLDVSPPKKRKLGLAMGNCFVYVPWRYAHLILVIDFAVTAGHQLPPDSANAGKVCRVSDNIPSSVPKVAS
ncbi:hypothetical protein HWV62_6059 [Athelia sp. TMB]|nr:hypothetical protein HWV62_6059 [Athelia sp. TMB]